MAIEYRLMRSEEASKVAKLVDVVFDLYVAPEYSQEGITSFRSYNDVQGIVQRSSSGHFMLVALNGDEPIGCIEIRNNQHVSMLFVAPNYQGKGIGRQLWSRALSKSQAADNSVREFTVHSSPNAVPIYERLGFHKTSPEQVRGGVRFIPMTCHLP